MKARLSKWLKIVLVFGLLAPILAGCAQGSGVSDQYPLESVSGSGSEVSYVYRAAGLSVPEAADALSERRKPEQRSEESPERMFLVYSDEIVQLQQDPDHPEDTLIEVSTYQYARENYSPSFLQAYLLASVLDDLFDRGRYQGGGYRGYGSKETYAPKQTYRTPTVEDKKLAPPMTVNRSGNIFRRSADADATVSSGGSSTAPASSSAGKIIRRGDDGGADSGKKGIFTKPKKTKVPKITKRIGKIGRRR